MNKTKEIKNSGILWIITFAAFVIVIAGLKVAQPIMVPFLFGVFLTILGTVPLNALQRLRVPKMIAIPCVILVYFLFFYGVFIILSNSFDGLLKQLPSYTLKLKELTSTIDEWLVSQGQQQLSGYILPMLQPDALLDIFGRTIKGFVSTVSSIVMVLLFITFMLNEAADFKNKLDAAFGKGINSQNMQGITKDVQKYLGIKTLTSILTGVCIALWAWIMGVDFPLLWGFLGMLLNYIPIIGSIIAAIPSILLSLLMLDFSSTVILTIGYVLLNFSISNFLEPILMGRRLGLSVLIVFCSLVFWGWVWGPAGALMAVPLTMILKIFLEHNDDLRWFAVFMGNRMSALHTDNKNPETE
jgi:AI-2 transport protein TqsA